MLQVLKCQRHWSAVCIVHIRIGKKDTSKYGWVGRLTLVVDYMERRVVREETQTRDDGDLSTIPATRFCATIEELCLKN